MSIFFCECKHFIKSKRDASLDFYSLMQMLPTKMQMSIWCTCLLTNMQMQLSMMQMSLAGMQMQLLFLFQCKMPLYGDANATSLWCKFPMQGCECKVYSWWCKYLLAEMQMQIFFLGIKCPLWVCHDANVLLWVCHDANAPLWACRDANEI